MTIPTTTVEAATVWTARVAWVVLAVAGSAAVDEALASSGSGARWGVAIIAWAIVGAVTVALLVRSVWSLTVVRVFAPLAVVAAVLTVVGGADAADIALLAVPALVAAAAALSPEFGRSMVQGSAYGDEARFPLRPPAAPGAAAVVSWLVWAAVAAAAVLLVGSDRPAVGIVVGALALGLCAVLLPRWHRLSRRWFVLVPAGVVVHDPMVLADTVMIPVGNVASLGLARADTAAADLTGPASGHAVEVTAAEPVRTVFAPTPSRPDGTAIHMTAFLVAPTRPGAVLTAARDRGLPVG